MNPYRNPDRSIDCGTEEEVTLGRCPYASEIENDWTEIWLCGPCVDRRADDI